jgi:hypothetical protein
MTSTPASPSANVYLGESTLEVWPKMPFQRVPQQQQQQVFVPPPQALTTYEAAAASTETQVGEVRVGAGGVDVTNDGRPTQVSMPGHPLLLNGRLLVYLSGFKCQKCTYVFFFISFFISYIQFY